MNDAHEIILVKISGEDRPGLTSTLTSILARYNATILDIGQSDIHNSISLGILFKSAQSDSGPIIKDILFEMNNLGVGVRFDPVSDEEYMKWVSMQGKNRYIVTLLGRKISSNLISRVAGITAASGLNIDSITRLTGRIPLDESKSQAKACVELSVCGNLTPEDREKVHMEFGKISRDLGYDISFQEENLFRRNRRLVCFDMDSTLVETECIDQLAERAGVGDQVRAITESAMRGEIDFKESFTRRVALLKGLDASVMQEIAENLPITEGADRLIRILKQYGYKIAILSGGFTYFGNYLKNKFGIDYVYANDLEIGPDGKLTGNYVGDIVDGRRKAEMLRLIAQMENINLQQVIAVGDGANDLPMLNIAGLGIAYHAKPKVKENAQQSISAIGLDGILYLLGFKDSYIESK
ncbi:MAG: phosphoserine phosphatase SerB [Bacteroidales bacterium]|nr:phosphoserine phosphatase SerB [Candidatus Equibacterium intestinale]